MNAANLVKELKASLRYKASCNRTERTAAKVAQALTQDLAVRAIAEWLVK